MTIYTLNPLQDARWRDFVHRHPEGSIFHTTGWLAALQRTYGYEPVAFTTSAPGCELKNGLVFCQVNSWLTGSRLVSLPFSDHCQPLVTHGGELQTVLEYLQSRLSQKKWRYVELKPLPNFPLGEVDSRFTKSAEYRFHRIDLRLPQEAIFRRFHESCVRRKIRKAEREHLRYDTGRTEALLRQFHHLLVLTRRRHRLPPQPIGWFRNLIDCLGDAISIRVVSRDSQPVASIVTLSVKKSIVYKYGCSDSRFNNLGGTALLFWKAMQEGKQIGAEELDLGRSDPGDKGLSVFKEHLGGLASVLTYYRYPLASAKAIRARSRPYLFRILSHLPDSLFTGVGHLLYRHMG
jgi:Acetyltransferase (GNAT) domain